ncbi:MAG: family 65 glycosyl hydrolase domain-containing protein [Lactovum sp.]
MENVKSMMDIDPWLVKSNNVNYENRRIQESLCSIGNGYMGMRGNFAETYSADSHQGIYLAGIWYPDKTRVGWWKNGYPEYFGKVVNAINFAKVRILIDDEEVDLATDEVENMYISLDMKKGTFSYNYQFGGVQVSTERFFSLAQKELAVFAFMFESIDGKEHDIKVASYVDADVYNESSNYGEKFWEIIELSNDGKQGSKLVAKTVENDFNIERFTVEVQQSYSGNFSSSEQSKSEDSVVDILTANLEAEGVKTLERRIVVTTSRDYESLEELDMAAQAISQELSQKSYVELYKAHAALWEERWLISDVEIEGSEEAQQGIRFNLFQLFSTYYGEDERLNIGPKGFTGEKYGGATYWDTEAYALPLYLALADQKVSKNLLKYRHNHLEAAKHNAKEQGLAGALYPMVTFNGIECHNEWEITFEEIHRNGAIAYAIYNYTSYTGDESYLENEGLEVLVELSRFWTDRVHLSSSEKYMIHGVTGPNEYENNINNNWYTNYLAAWTLSYTTESLVKHPRPDLKVDALELAHWHDIVQRMYYPVDPHLGIFVQHDGFLDKDLKPVSELKASDLPLNQNWSWDKILRSPYIKQADVLQGIYFFGHNFSLAEKSSNFNFYEPYTVHESSLSPSVHSILASELGYMDKAVEMYARTARLDLDNYNNDTEDGLHITSMTGSWLAIVQGFAQMKTDVGLTFAPKLPKNWKSYKFRINYRGNLLEIKVAEKISIQLISGENLAIRVYDQGVILTDTYETDTRLI